MFDPTESGPFRLPWRAKSVAGSPVARGQQEASHLVESESPFLEGDVEGGTTPPKKPMKVEVVSSRCPNPSAEGRFLCFQHDLGIAPESRGKGKQFVSRQTLVFVPNGFAPINGDLDVLLYLHGYKEPCCEGKVDDTIIRLFETSCFSALPRSVAESRKNVILVAPTLGRFGSAGPTGDFAMREPWKLLESAKSELATDLKLEGTQLEIRNIILAGHSGAGSKMRALLGRGDPELKKVRAFWGIDCTYADCSDCPKQNNCKTCGADVRQRKFHDAARRWHTFVRGQKSIAFTFVRAKEGPASQVCQILENEIRDKRLRPLPNLEFVASKVGHCEAPAEEMAKLLRSESRLDNVPEKVSEHRSPFESVRTRELEPITELGEEATYFESAAVDELPPADELEWEDAFEVAPFAEEGGRPCACAEGGVGELEDEAFEQETQFDGEDVDEFEAEETNQEHACPGCGRLSESNARDFERTSAAEDEGAARQDEIASDAELGIPAKPFDEFSLEPEYESLPSDVQSFAVSLGAEWSRRLNGARSAASITSCLLNDYQETLQGARLRFKKKFGSGRFTADAVTRAWMLSREMEMKFKVSPATPRLSTFDPPAEKVALVRHDLIEDSDKAPVAPLLGEFVTELRRRFTNMTASNYEGHGGGKFSGRGYSIDLYIEGLDDRGFYPKDEAVSFLRAVHEAAVAVGAQWRVIYNDFDVADVVNRALGRQHVVFVGQTRKSSNKVKGLNWHGPAPLILHFHIDLTPLAGATASSWKGTASSASSTPASVPLPSTPGATSVSAEVVRFAQRVLNASAGENLAVDGDLGRNTRAALERFRQRYGLGAGGALDATTGLALAQHALEGLAQQSLFVQLGTRDTATDQQLARFKGEHGLGMDPAFDTKTRAALAQALEAQSAGSGKTQSVPPAASPARTRCENQIIALVQASPLVNFDWNRHGKAPIGYLKGMALTFARVYCKLEASDASAQVMARADSNKPGIDALSVYKRDFADLNMDNSADGPDTLRHLFVLLTGLGIRESSGKYCEGRDMSAKGAHDTPVDFRTAEAGVFQMSFTLGVGSSDAQFAPLRNLYEQLRVIPYSGYRDVFMEGVPCKPELLTDFGPSAAGRFREFCVMQPALSAELAALGLRMRRHHWGPIERHTVTLSADCDALFANVQAVVDEGQCCPF